MNGSDDERALPSRIFASSGSSPVTASCSLFVSSHPLFDSIAEGIALKSAILFNDSRLSLKRPPFPDRLASTFLPAREERCLLSRSQLHQLRFRRSLEGTSAHTKPQLPLDPRPATSLLTVREMFILPFYRPLQRIFGFRPWPQSESQSHPTAPRRLLANFSRFRFYPIHFSPSRREISSKMKRIAAQ